MEDKTNAQQRIKIACRDFRCNSHDTFYRPVYTPCRRKGVDCLLAVYRGIEGCKSQYPDLLSFWPHVLFSYCEDIGDDAFFDAVASQSLCEPLSVAAAMDRLSNQLGALLVPLSYELFEEDTVIAGYLMFDETDWFSLILQTDSRYLAFFWESHLQSRHEFLFSWWDTAVPEVP
ncbi:MAG TPA: hypothetical protein VGO93_20700 [Candidatus Xenobia bacterium]